MVAKKRKVSVLQDVNVDQVVRIFLSINNLGLDNNELERDELSDDDDFFPDC